MEDTITQDTPSTHEQPTSAPAQPPATQLADAPPAVPPAVPPTAPPVEPPKEQPNPDAPPATFGEAVEYEKTGDANLDLALAFVGKHGLGPEHPAMVAAINGDFGALRALLHEKGVPGAEAYLALAEKGYQDHGAREAEKLQAVQQIVVQAAGDEATWAQTLEWASANAEPHEKEAVNTALAQGGVVAEAMAAFLVNQYRNATGTTYAPAATAVRPDAARGAANPAGGALSPAQYGMAVAALRRTQGTNFEQTDAYRQLQARRAAWRD